MSAKRDTEYPFMILDKSGAASSNLRQYFLTAEGRQELESLTRLRIRQTKARKAAAPKREKAEALAEARSEAI